MNISSHSILIDYVQAVGHAGVTRVVLTSTEGGCVASAAFAVDISAASSAEDAAIAVSNIDGACSVAVDVAGCSAAGSGGLKKTGKGDPPIGDPFTSTLS